MTKSRNATGASNTLRFRVGLIDRRDHPDVQAGVFIGCDGGAVFSITGAEWLDLAVEYDLPVPPTRLRYDVELLGGFNATPDGYTFALNGAPILPGMFRREIEATAQAVFETPASTFH